MFIIRGRLGTAYLDNTAIVPYRPDILDNEHIATLEVRWSALLTGHIKTFLLHIMQGTQ